MKLTRVNKVPGPDSFILLISDISSLEGTSYLSPEELAYAKKTLNDKKNTMCLDRLGKMACIHVFKRDDNNAKRLESCRKAGDKIAADLNGHKIKNVVVIDVENVMDEALSMAEGIMLGNYQFVKYLKEKKENSLKSVNILSKAVKKSHVDMLNIVVDATCLARTLVNEPVSFLNAVRLSNEIRKMGTESGAKVEVLNKKKIESLKMGGLLAVNKGSVDPPTFTIMEWKPEKPANKKPVVLVGKGVVFDTGGLNLKPGNYMDDMKCDMAGAATMSATIYAVARAGLPVHVIGLIPATDNRLNGNAYVSGDVIRMYDGTTVEVKNTDAEGRMILADALSYAKKYKPELVIDAATLTGAARRAIGKYGIVAMENKAGEQMESLKESGERVYERIAVFPFWEEYAELIKSNIADIKNIGGLDAGMITAGKFLEHFTDYPFIHLDIAGPAHIEKKDSYRTTGGTGTGVRLLFDFLKNYCTD